MAGPSKIEWTDATWNPIVGCSVLTPGCTNCYAMKMAARIEAMKRSHYDGTTRKVNGNAVWTGKLALAPDNILLEPLRRKKPTTYFVNSMGDLFHEQCSTFWITKALAVMAMTPHHTYQVLTKRAHIMRAFMSDLSRRNEVELAAESLNPSVGTPISPKYSFEWPLPNVWLGVSTERQQEADERIPHLLQTPAAVRFISAEPLLGPIDLTEIDGGADRKVPREHWTTVDTDDSPPAIRIDALEGYRHQRFGHFSEQCSALDWVIVGGESGSNARPMHPDWARSLRDQCTAAGVPYFFKQWGEHVTEIVPGTNVDLRDLAPNQAIAWGDGKTNHTRYTRVGKKAAGRILDGIEHNAMPQRVSG